MNISLIAAVDEKLAIGKDNQLLWHLPNDFQHFKTLTLNKPVVMGRKTYLSIGKPLPKRHNIVLTRDTSFQADGITIVHSIEHAIHAAGSAEEVMIIGGADIYRQFLPLAQTLYLTQVQTQIEADTFFPSFDDVTWQETSHEAHPADERHAFAYAFVTYKRV